MVKWSSSSAILERMASEGRVVLSDWRALVYLRRATFALSASQRRWTKMPRTRNETWPILRRMEERGELEAVQGVRHFYRASVPYARVQPIEEEEVLIEAHPYSTLGYLSALFYHGLTEMMPKELVAVAPKDGKGGLLPPDTTTVDWEGVGAVAGSKVPRVLGTPVRWKVAKPERYFGLQLYRQRGYPVRVTTPERTLVDGLLDPEASGGFENVLNAWRLASDVLDVDSVVYNAERLGEKVLRQRVGFILEQLGLHHQSLEEWRKEAVRGGSSKLLRSAPYTVHNEAARYDERWSLSLNAPTDTLQIA